MAFLYKRHTPSRTYFVISSMKQLNIRGFSATCSRNIPSFASVTSLFVMLSHWVEKQYSNESNQCKCNTTISHQDASKLHTSSNLIFMKSCPAIDLNYSSLRQQNGYQTNSHISGKYWHLWVLFTIFEKKTKTFLPIEMNMQIQSKSRLMALHLFYSCMYPACQSTDSPVRM